MRVNNNTNGIDKFYVVESLNDYGEWKPEGQSEDLHIIRELAKEVAKREGAEYTRIALATHDGYEDLYFIVEDLGRWDKIK